MQAMVGPLPRVITPLGRTNSSVVMSLVSPSYTQNFVQRSALIYMNSIRKHQWRKGYQERNPSDAPPLDLSDELLIGDTLLD